MKNMVFGLITGGTVLLFAILFLTLLHKNVRREELEQSFAEAMELTMQTWDEEQKHTAELCNEEVLADYLLQALCVQLDSDSKVTVQVLAADADKGLLSARVTEEFTYPGGQTGRVSVERTMIADREEIVPEEIHTVTFFRSKEDMQSGENIYKKMQIQHGDRMIQPSEPQDEFGGKQFREWRDAEDYLSDFSQTVESDLVYYAVFEE